MSSDSNQRSLPCQVGMKLVLKINEGCVVESVEFDISEDSTGEVRANLRSFLADVDGTLLPLFD